MTISIEVVKTFNKIQHYDKNLQKVGIEGIT